MPRRFHAEPSRLRVLRLLADGLGISRVAGRLGMSRQAVRKHADALEEAGALRWVPNTNPRLYQPGPLLAEVMEELVRQPTDRPGRSGRQPPGAAVRVDAGTWAWRVVEGPRVVPPWSRTWEASGVANARMAYGFGGKVYRVWERRGARSVSLCVQPPVEWRPGPASVRQADGERVRACAGAARAFAREYGYTLQGSLEAEQPTEYALPAPGLAPTGRPGLDPVWVDESPGEGQPELESRSAEVVAAVADLPAWRARVDAELDAVHAELREHRRVALRLVEVHKEAARAQREVLSAQVQRAAGAPAPDPDGMEVA